MKIQATATKPIVIRHPDSNIEYVFRDKATSYNFNSKELYRFVLNALRDYEDKGLVELMEPKESAAPTITKKTTTKKGGK